MRMKRYEIRPQSGMRIAVNKNQKITIIDVEGGQVADFFAQIAGEPEEYLSTAVTINCNESLRLAVGDRIYSNLYRPMFRIEQDDVRAHDLLFPSCSKRMYDFFYQNGENHPNCLDNINQALGTNRTIIQPVNFFMNTVIEETGKIEIRKPLSRAGDKVVLTALENCVLGISACSVSECDTNSGNCTSIEVRIED